MPIKTTQDEIPTPNLTSMIDVVFLLIIFFMVATKFGDLERNIELEIPRVAGEGTSQQPPRVRDILVFADGHWELDGERVERPALIGALQSGEHCVVIRADARCQFQHVAAAMGVCREAGISELGITVRVGDTVLR